MEKSELLLLVLLDSITPTVLVLYTIIGSCADQPNTLRVPHLLDLQGDLEREPETT
jgi:hypothetical protein